MSHKQPGPIYKVYLLGDSKVGKTCFIQRYVQNSFSEVFMTTIGSGNSKKQVPLENGKIATLEIWDTAGQERYHSISKSYVKKADGIVLLYDITSSESFNGVTNWMEDIKNNAPKKAQIILVGNKCDLENKRQVEKIKGEEKAKEYNLDFFETSCLQDLNVADVFKTMVKKIYKVKKNETQEHNTIKLDLTKDNEKKCCK